MPDIHISGLVTNMDVQSLVDQLLTVETKKVTALQDTKTNLQASVSAWSDISGSLSSLNDALDTLRSYDTWSRLTATSSDSAAVTATAGNSADEAKYTISVTDLAQAHSVASDSTTTLGLTGVNDVLVGKVPGLSAGDSFSIEGQTISISAGDTLSSLRDKINDAAELMADGDKVVATILDGRLVITRVNTGSTELTMSNSSGTPLVDLGIFSSPGVYKKELVAAQDAKFSVNGVDVTRSENSGLNDVIENVVLNLNGTTGAGKTVTLSVQRDTAPVKAAIQNFVTTYNTTVTKMQSYIGIDLTDPLHPVVGALQGDTFVGSILNNLRGLATSSKSPYMNSGNASYTYNGNTGVADSLEDIGVWTSGKANSLAIVDEDKLDFMLVNHFDMAEQMIRGVAGTSGYDHGVAEDMYSYVYNMSSSLSGQVAQHVSVIQDRIARYNQRIEDAYSDLDEYEKRLWAQFGAMEDAIAKMQSETAWLSSLVSTKDK